MRKLLTIILVVILTATETMAQRVTDVLDRGLVAVPSSTGMLVSWRVFGEEYYDVTYNLYRDGSKIAEGLTVSNYYDASGTSTSSYQVSAVVQGEEQTKCDAITPWANGYKSIVVATATDRDGTESADYYTLNDVSLGDVNGDGVSEFIVKRPASDANDYAQSVRFNQLDCYDINGNRLWWIDLGPNMIAGPDKQWDCVCYDWDQDGKAEVLLRGADNMIIHYKDNGEWTTKTIGDPTVDTRDAQMAAASQPFSYTGNEYLLYLDGTTGLPYQIGPASHPDYMDYPIARGSDGDWGYGIRGHRSTKHYFGAPFLDGRKASIFLGRGCYTQHKMVALDVDKDTHALTQRWYWECTDKTSPWYGNGYHNFAIGDVDWDGRDEIIFGSMVIDDNGKGLSTTGLGHGDSQHCSDFDPYRKYEEQFACNEDHPGMNYRNAVTSEIYVRKTASDDDGRALMGNFTNSYPGSQGRTLSSGGWISSISDKAISELGTDAFINWGDLNDRIYWDGDLCDEYFESPGTEGYGVVYKPGTGNRLLSATDTKLNNSTKNNPCAQGDIFGDWREELVLRKSDNTELRVYTTPYSTTYRIPTLWSDPQYRNAMVWQSMGYNQTPHKSYFLGELEDITQAPPTNTMTGKTEIVNNEQLTVNNGNAHLILCETNNTAITIPDEGTSAHVIEFNIPSWVQGTAESNTTTKATDITYTYYTCDVTGGALTGTTRLVKEGEGILNLPNVTNTHTGNTDIWGGTVNFSGTMQNSAVWMNRHTTLNTTSGNFKSLTMEYGSTLNITTAATVGTLELHEGARVKLNLDNGDKINITDLTLRHQNWEYGPKYLAPVFEVTSATALETGKTYQIGTVSGNVSGFLSKVTVETNVDMGYQANLSVSNGKLYLSVGYDQTLCKANTTSIYERGTTNAWSTSDIATGEWVKVSGTGSEAAISSDPYLTMTRAANSSNKNSYKWEKTISTTGYETLAMTATWNPGQSTGDNNHSYLTFGDVTFDLIGQSGVASITIGSTTKVLNTTTNLRGQDWNISLNIDTETKEVIYSISLYGTTYTGSGITTSDFSNIDLGTTVNTKVNWSLTQSLKSIDITGSTYTYAGAKYNVKYVDETGTEIKDQVTRMGIYGTTPTLEDEDTETFTSSDEAYQYVYVSNDVSTIAEDGSSVFTVTFNKKYKYAINAIDTKDNTTLLTVLTTGYVDDDESIVSYYDHGILVDGSYYFTPANSASPYYAATVTKSNLTVSVPYTIDEDVTYYVEGENMTITRQYDYTIDKGIASGGNVIAPYSGAHFYTTALPEGLYNITVRGIQRTTNNQSYTVRTTTDNENFTEKGTITFTKSATGEQTITGVSVEDGAYVDFLNTYGGNAQNYIDYVVMSRQKANYTVKFQDANGNTLKDDETRVGYINATLLPSSDDKTNILYNGATYVYTGYSLSSGTTVLADGSQVMTLTYQKRNEALEYVGESDNSTAFWGDFSSTYTLKDGEKYHFIFTNYNTGIGNNWENWVLACVNGSGHSTTDRSDYAEHFVLRADDYAWGPEGNSNEDEDFKNLITKTNDYNLTTFVADMKGATVDMYVEYANSTVSVTSTITTTGSTTYNYTFSKKDITADEVSLFFTVEKAYLEILTAEKTVSVTEPTDVATTTSTYNVSWVAKNQMTDNGDGTFTTSSKAGNSYALAIADLSSINGISEATKVTIEFDSEITGGRMLIGIGDKSTRGTTANGSSKSSYNSEGLFFRYGTKDGSIYSFNSSGAYNGFNKTVHCKFVLDRTNSRYDYTISSDGETLYYTNSKNVTSYLTGTNISTTISNATILEAYSWSGGTVVTLGNVTVTVEGSPELILEPKSVDTYTAGVYDYVTVNRSFKAGYSSLCVPFNTTVNEFTGDDDDAYVAYLSEVTKDENNVYTLTFTNTQTIVANKPYIIYLSKALSAPTVKNKPVFAESAKTLTVGGWSMTGNYEVGKSMSGLYGVANNSKIMKGGSSSTLNGLAAFLTGPADAGSSAKSAFSGMAEEGIPTAADKTSAAGCLTITEIYSLNGTRQECLLPGMNILKMSDGTVRKVIIK